jgi:tRNA:m4X modification enzyme
MASLLSWRNTCVELGKWLFLTAMHVMSAEHCICICSLIFSCQNYRTDLALKSMEPVKEHVSACIMATCCHGACNWDDYVGRDYLCAVMDDPACNFVFGSAEFDMLCQWSGGAVHVNKMDDGSNGLPGGKQGDAGHSRSLCQDESLQPSNLGITKVVDSLNLQSGNQGLGRACQRMIDYGRLVYLRNNLFPGCSKPAELLYYVPEDVTPQNAALVVSTGRLS